MKNKQKIYDLKNQRMAALDEAKTLATAGDLGETYVVKMAAVDSLSKQIEALEAICALEEQGMEPGEEPTAKALAALTAAVAGAPGKEVDSVKAFASAARSGFDVAKAAGDYNSEGVDADGGYTVPQDILTRVESFRDSRASLRPLVGVENVSTNKGRRTYKSRKQQTGFSKVAEGGKITKLASPQFSVLNYEVSKYAGFLPVTTELLEDSDTNITQVLVEWLGDEARVTDNKLILAAINKKAKVAIAGLDGLRKAILMELDSAFRSTTKIITNANGIFWLSTLKDANGRDLLTPIPSEPGKLQLACGPIVVAVEEFPNADLPNDGTKIPFIVGDLQEGIRLFDRKQMTITSSDVAQAGDFNAFEQGMVLIKAVLREDVQQRDADAYVNGYIDTAAVQAPAG